MKKTLITLGLAVAAVSSSFAQGTFVYSVRTPAVIAPIYAPEPGNESLSKKGNTTAGLPQGEVVYNGAKLTGSGYYAALFYAVGTGQAETSLIFAPGSLTTFRTSTTLAGTIAVSSLTLPGVAVGSTITAQLRVWDNAGVADMNTWERALGTDAGYAGAASLYRGTSELITIANLGDSSNPILPEMTGIRSFNIYAVPEPSTFVLAGLGAAGLLIFRRRK